MNDIFGAKKIDFVQHIRFTISFHTADSWPQVFDDSEARADWKWKPKYDLEKLVKFMVRDVQQNYIENNFNGGANNNAK